jgi:hypothetical protein
MRSMRVVLAVLVLCMAALAAESPFSGTWKLNLAKSKLPPPAPKSETAQVVADDNNLHMKDAITDDKGQAMTVTYDAKFDGKDYPVTGDPNSDSISFQRVDANTIKGTGKKAGNVVSTATIVVSSDGKTTTVDFVDSSQGKPQSGTAIYDKQ